MRNIKIPILYLAITALLLAGCKDRKTSEIQRDVIDVTFKESGNRTADTLVSRIDYIGLPPISNHLPGSVDKLCADDSTIIIADYKYGKIFVYDREGHPKALINQRGQGPGEYVEIRCMAVDSDYIHVVDNARRQLLTYSIHDGSFVKSRKMPVIADDIETLGDGGFVFASILERGAKPAIDQERARLFIADMDLNVTDTYYQYEGENYESIGQRYYLTRNGDTIVFSSAMFDGLTLIDRDNPGIQKQIRFTFDHGLNGQSGVPLDEISEYQHLVVPPFVSGDYMFVTYANGNGETDYGIWDTKANEMLKNPESDIHHAFMPIVGSYGKQMYGYVESHEQYTVPVGYGFAKASEDVENILKDGGAALVVYNIK